MTTEFVTSITEAKAYIEKHLAEGATCPCCGQYARLYKRKLNSEQARALIAFYRMGAGFHHIRDVAVRGGDYGKLLYWGLLQPKGDVSHDGNSSGFWRITELGRQFVEGKAVVPAYVYVYNGAARGGSSELIGIRKALGRRFNYEELMAGK